MTKGLEVLRNALIDAIAKGRTWALDPIDGTVNMTRGIPLYGMQGVFMRDRAPEASAIRSPTSSSQPPPKERSSTIFPYTSPNRVR